MRRSIYALATLLVCSCPTIGRADDATSSAKAPRLLSPEARRFLSPPALAYWVGSERVLEGELSLAPPRPLEGTALTTALDDHLATTSYLRLMHSHLRRARDDWTLVEISSLHDLPGGAVLGAHFRADFREHTSVQGIANLALPFAFKTHFVSTLGVGAHSATTPVVVVASELRSSRSSAGGVSAGIDVSQWTWDGARVLGTVAVVYRLTEAVAIEERLALGAWTGAQLGGVLAGHFTTSALQSLGHRLALQERATLGRGAALAGLSEVPDHPTWSTDIAVGVRLASASGYGFLVEADDGGEPGTLQRWGVGVTAYGTLF